jgi:hypothetical protein
MPNQHQKSHLRKAKDKERSWFKEKVDSKARDN